MKRLLFVMMLMLPLSAAAQTKVGFLDPLAALEMAEDVQQRLASLDQQMETETRRMRQAEQALEQEVKEAQQRLERDRMTMSDQEVMGLQSEIQQKIMQFQQQQRGLQQQYAQSQRALLEEMQPRLQQAVDAVAKKRELSMVVNAQAVMFAVDGLDITDDVGELLNKKN